MIDYSVCTLDEVSVHRVGNRQNEEELLISKHRLDLNDKTVEEMLKKYFLAKMRSDEFYHFTFSNEDFKMNPIYKYCHDVFEGIGDFHLNSINIAKHLFEITDHPMIKSGDLFVAGFSRLMVDYNEFSAIGFFKCENRHSFLKLEHGTQEFNISKEEGIQIDKPDKACIIFNDQKDNGYRVCVLDSTNRSEEAQYWKDRFLQLVPCKDEYHSTKDFLDIAKNFVTKVLPENFEVNKTDQIDMLNRSMDYFKTHDTFDRNEFEEEVLGDELLIDSFKKFDKTYREENNIELGDNFDIHLSAVKKQAKVFKSILKLDKNFHIYIHGNKEMIVPGVEKDGRKFYKIYYENEA